jgi:hypothetical protein
MQQPPQPTQPTRPTRPTQPTRPRPAWTAQQERKINAARAKNEDGQFLVDAGKEAALFGGFLVAAAGVAYILNHNVQPGLLNFKQPPLDTAPVTPNPIDGPTIQPVPGIGDPALLPVADLPIDSVPIADLPPTVDAPTAGDVGGNSAVGDAYNSAKEGVTDLFESAKEGVTDLLESDPIAVLVLGGALASVAIACVLGLLGSHEKKEAMKEITAVSQQNNQPAPVTAGPQSP